MANEKVVVEFTNEQVKELFHLLEDVKVAYPELHEVVYQAMFKSLMSRINRG